MKSVEASLIENWLVICSSKSLRTKAITRTVLGKSLVLFRSPAGVSILENRCPHRNVPLSKGKIISQQLECPYHGWTFDGQGKCVRVPGLSTNELLPQCRVPSFPAIEQDGFIWVYLGEKQHSKSAPYRHPFLSDKNYHSFHWQSSVNASFLNTVENFLDPTHTHFVHSRLIRKDQKRQSVKAIIRRDKNKVEVEYSQENHSGLISKLFESQRDKSFGRFFKASIMQLEYRTAQHTSFMITACLTPESSNRQIIYATISFRKRLIPAKLVQWILTPFLHVALQQDLNILQQQSQNLEKFGGEKFTSTRLDLIRSHITRLYTTQSPLTEVKEVLLEL